MNFAAGQARIALGPPTTKLAGRLTRKTGGAAIGLDHQIGRGGDDDVLPEVVGDAPAAGRPPSLMPLDHGRVLGGRFSRVSIAKPVDRFS